MQELNPVISFVSPVYKAEKILENLVEEIQKVMQVIDKPYEIILVDDRSPDNSWEVMKTISNKFPEVKSIRLLAAGAPELEAPRKKKGKTVPESQKGSFTRMVERFW